MRPLPPSAGFAATPTTLENRTTCGQDMPPIRPAIHNDGIIYAAYYHNQPGLLFSGAIPSTW